MAVRVLLASDARLYREAMERMLRESGRVEVAGAVDCASEAIQSIQRLQPEVVLLDMTMSEAFAFARRVTKAARPARVVALGMPEVESQVITCAEAGVAGYVTREASLEDLIAAIEAAARGEAHCSPKIAGLLFRRIAHLSAGRRSDGPFADLTARESQVLRLMQQGLSNKMISRRLGIELPTVKHHVHSIFRKLGVHRRTEAVSLAIRSRGEADCGAQGH